MPISRRDVLFLGGGGVAGLAVTPIPYKLLDDTAIWTQNWGLIPRPVRGVTVTRASACTMCGAGCGLKAQGVGAGVYSLAGVAAHPVSGGALCPGAFGAHQLPFHPARLRSATVQGSPATLDQALTAAVKAIKAAHTAGLPIAIADERPRRQMSLAWRRFAAQTPRGMVANLPTPESSTLDAYETLTGARHHSLGFDLEKARLIAGIGAPLLDGWGAPGRMVRIWTAGDTKFWQADVRLSRTARLAGENLLYEPGTESELARQLAPRYADARRAEVAALAGALESSGPAVVIGAAAGPAIAALNAQLGASCIVARRPAPGPDESHAVTPVAFDSIADGSLAVLIYEAPASGLERSEASLRRKLAAGGTLIRLGAFRGAGDIQLPVPAFLEMLDDAAQPREARVSSWTVAPPLLEPPAGLTTPATLLARAAEAIGATPSDPKQLMEEKAAALAASKRGRFYQFKSGAAEAMPAAAAWKDFAEGAVWVDDASTPAPALKQAPEILAAGQPRPAGYELTLVESGWLGAAVPLATKVEQEMRLRPVKGEASMNPGTAAALDLAAGASVVVETPSARRPARLRLDARVRPGQVEMTAGSMDAGSAPCRVGRGLTCSA